MQQLPQISPNLSSTILPHAVEVFFSSSIQKFDTLQPHKAPLERLLVVAKDSMYICKISGPVTRNIPFLCISTVYLPTDRPYSGVVVVSGQPADLVFDQCLDRARLRQVLKELLPPRAAIIDTMTHAEAQELRQMLKKNGGDSTRPHHTLYSISPTSPPSPSGSSSYQLQAHVLALQEENHLLRRQLELLQHKSSQGSPIPMTRDGTAAAAGTMDEQAAALQRECDELRKDNKTMEEYIEKLDGHYSELRKNNKRTKAENNEVKTSLSTLQEALESMHSERDLMEARFSHNSSLTDQQLEQLAAIEREWQRKAEKKDSRIESLTIENEHLKDMCDLLTEQINKNKATTKDVQKQLTIKDQHIEELSKQNDEAFKESSYLREQVSTLEKKMVDGYMSSGNEDVTNGHKVAKDMLDLQEEAKQYKQQLKELQQAIDDDQTNNPSDSDSTKSKPVGSGAKIVRLRQALDEKEDEMVQFLKMWEVCLGLENMEKVNHDLDKILAKYDTGAAETRELVELVRAQTSTIHKLKEKV